MKFNTSVFLLLLSLLGLKPSLFGQAPDSTSFVKISALVLEGNNKTKDFIILREVGFAAGDSILVKDTATVFESTKNKIFNTGLFVKVKLQAIPNLTGSAIILKIIVSERWYIFPIPIFELADRNFNEWWVQRRRDPRRIEYGIRFRHDNFLGRNQELRVVLQTGFTKKYEIFHVIPYINKAKTLGVDYGLSFSTNKSVGFAPVNNQLEFLSSDNILRRRLVALLNFSYRNKFFLTHTLGISFRRNTIDDELFTVTNSYLGEGQDLQRFFQLSYTFDYNKTDINYYPTKGYSVTVGFTKHGLGLFGDVNQGELEGDYSKYWTLSNNVFVATRASFKTSYPSRQAYILQQGLGYNENFVRGYQPYVVDGQHYGLSRSALKFKVLEFTQDFGRLIPIKQFKKVPYAIYLKLFTDHGYVINNDETISNEFSDQLNSGFGLGIDIVSYYDAVIRLEAAVTDFGEFGFNIHMERGI